MTETTTPKKTPEKPQAPLKPEVTQIQPLRSNVVMQVPKNKLQPRQPPPPPPGLLQGQGQPTYEDFVSDEYLGNDPRYCEIIPEPGKFVNNGSNQLTNNVLYPYQPALPPQYQHHYGPLEPQVNQAQDSSSSSSVGMGGAGGVVHNQQLNQIKIYHPIPQNLAENEKFMNQVGKDFEFLLKENSFVLNYHYRLEFLDDAFFPRRFMIIVLSDFYNVKVETDVSLTRSFEIGSAYNDLVKKCGFEINKGRYQNTNKLKFIFTDGCTEKTFNGIRIVRKTRKGSQGKLTFPFSYRPCFKYKKYKNVKRRIKLNKENSIPKQVVQQTQVNPSLPEAPPAVDVNGTVVPLSEEDKKKKSFDDPRMIIYGVNPRMGSSLGGTSVNIFCEILQSDCDKIYDSIKKILVIFGEKVSVPISVKLIRSANDLKDLSSMESMLYNKVVCSKKCIRIFVRTPDSNFNGLVDVTLRFFTENNYFTSTIKNGFEYFKYNPDMPNGESNDILFSSINTQINTQNINSQNITTQNNLPKNGTTKNPPNYF